MFYISKFFYRIFFIVIFCVLGSLFLYLTFSSLYRSNSIVISYGLNSFDICLKYPNLWVFIKKSFVFFSLLSLIIISNFIFSIFFQYISIFKKSHLESSSKKENLSSNQDSIILKIGKSSNNQSVSLPEKALYQNFLITGTIGSGKTSSAMYPFTKQLIEFSGNNSKIGMLILDVKGNYSNYVYNVCKKEDLLNNLIVISLHSNIKYNPLDKPYLKPYVLANRLKTILLLFSENNSESFWLDKAEQVLGECIKLCRLYNNNYVTFLELHKLIFYPDYYKEKVHYLRDLFLNNKLSKKQIYDLNSCLNFFQKEYEMLDTRTLSILKSEIGRITNTFINDSDVLETFSPDKKDINFYGFKDVLKNGKIVVLSMNIAEYRNLSSIIADYLKLDFQSEVLYNISKNKVVPSAFICDEYDKYASKIDGDFFSLSREAKCINIISTQSFSSLKSILKDEASVNVIIQNLVNKIWFRTDDVYTIEQSQKILGKEKKTFESRSISENAKETKFNYITNRFNSSNSSISESYTTNTQMDFMFDSGFFTQELETFSALAFLSDGSKMLKPSTLQLYPYFRNS